MSIYGMDLSWTIECCQSVVWGTTTFELMELKLGATFLRVGQLKNQATRKKLYELPTPS